MQTQSEITEKDKTRKRPILGAKREQGEEGHREMDEK